MARSAPKSTKKTNKKPPKTNITELYKQYRVWVFVLVFGVIGAAFALRSFAQTDLPSKATDIVAAYIDSKPTLLTKDEKDQKKYESYSASYMVLADGSLICDTGNAEGTVTTGTLSKGQLKKLHAELKELDLGTLPNDITAPGNDTHTSTFKGYVLSDGNSISGFSVYEDGQKPDKLAKMESKILKSCEVATKREERGKTKEFSVPANKTAAATSIVEKIANAVAPKAAAAPAAGAGQVVDSATANNQRDSVNYIRAISGIPQLGQQGCLDIIAGQQAKRMIDAGYIYHNPNLLGEFNFWCNKPTWTIIGENVGSGYSSQAIFNAYMGSPAHKANIVDRRYRYIGTNAYKVNATGKIFTVTVFAAW